MVEVETTLVFLYIKPGRFLIKIADFQEIVEN